MAKITKKLKRLALILATVLLIPSTFGVSGGVYAAAETEGAGSAIMHELGGLTVGGEKFNVEDYPADEEGTPQLLYLNELGYGYTAAKQVTYGLALYIYNPAQLDIVQDVRNMVQMKIGNAERYTKYSLSVIEGSADKLFYKLGVSFTAEEKSTALAALDKDVRRYEVSSVEFYLEGFNATSFDISPTRVYTYTGYAAGLGAGKESTLTNTLSYTEAGGTETIPLEVKHTSWRPEGTNGNSAWTQDTIHSVYFAVAKELDEQYDYLKSVQAHWIEALTAPILVTKSKNMYESLVKSYIKNLQATDLGRDSKYLNNRDGLEYAFHTYPIGTVSDYRNEYFYGSDAALFDIDDKALNKNPFNKRNCTILKQLPLIMYDEYGNGVITSTQLTEMIQERNYDVSEDILPYKVADKYQERFFSSYDTDVTTKIIKIGKASDEEKENETIITADKLNLYSEEVRRSWWQSVFGGASVSNQQNYKPIDAIQVITDKDGVETKTPKELSDSLYISERDAEDFRTFYNNNKADSTVYLMRFAISEYWEQSTYDYKYDYTVGTRKCFTEVSHENSYIAKEKVYLNFDLIDFEYVKKGKSYVIPVSMSPIDIFPELTPPPIFKYDDFWKYAAVIAAALTVFYIVYKIVGKAIRR